MSLIAVRPGRGSTGTKLMVLLGSCVLEGGVALICGMALLKRLESRLSYSPLVVALGSCAGLFGATAPRLDLATCGGRVGALRQGHRLGRFERRYRRDSPDRHPCSRQGLT